MRGMVVTLDDKGTLVVSYLGTDPMLNPVGFVEVSEGRTVNTGTVHAACDSVKLLEV
jgi:hypothetical protein